MHNTPINNNGTGKVSGSNSTAQNSKPLVNVNNLFKQLAELQGYVQDMRQARDNNKSNNNGEQGKSTNNGFNESLIERELQYLSQIFGIQSELDNAGVKGNSPPAEENNPVSDQSLSGQSEAFEGSSEGGFSSFLNNLTNSFGSAMEGIGNGFNSALNGISDGAQSLTNTVGNGFNSFTEAVGGGLKAVGTAINNAKNWFVSQLSGATNVNEDGGKYNSNCGFVCLEMIRRLRGGEGNAMTANGDIENDRRVSGVVMDESKGALPEELAMGAQNLGMNAKATVGTLKSAADAIGQDKNIILAVDPSKYKAGLSPSGHAVVLLSVDPSSGTATIADPAEQNGPITVSLKDLGAAMDAAGNRMVEIG